MQDLEKMMWHNTAWRYNHRNGLELESFHGLDRDIELFNMAQRIAAWTVKEQLVAKLPPAATGAELLAAIATRRKTAHKFILEHPENYCVCNGCGGVLRLPVKNICKTCHSYRFDYSRAGVMAAADLLGARPIASGCPIIPRLAADSNLT